MPYDKRSQLAAMLRPAGARRAIPQGRLQQMMARRAAGGGDPTRLAGVMGMPGKAGPPRPQPTGPAWTQQAPQRTPSGAFAPVNVGAASPAALPVATPTGSQLPGVMAQMGSMFEAYDPGVQRQQVGMERLSGTTQSTLQAAAQRLGISPEQALQMLKDGTLAQALQQAGGGTTTSGGGGGGQRK